MHIPGLLTISWMTCIFILVNLNFFIYKKGIIVVPTSQGGWLVIRIK